MAPLILGFVVVFMRQEEHRSRLLLAGPLTPRQLAGVTVLLPTVLFVVGVFAATVVMAASLAITGKLEREALNIIGFVGGQLFAYIQMGILAQEATAARRQHRARPAAAGWAGFVVAVLLLATLYLVLAAQIITWTHLIIGHVLVAVLAMLANISLISGRNDFTR